EDGVQADSIGGLLHAGDLVFDAIDVTTPQGISAKLALHEAGVGKRLSVITAYDIASTQFIEIFDYSKQRAPLRGRVRDPQADPGGSRRPRAAGLATGGGRRQDQGGADRSLEKDALTDRIKGLVLADGANEFDGLFAMVQAAGRWPGLRREMRGAPGYVAHHLWFAWPTTVGILSWWEDEASAYRFAHLP